MATHPPPLTEALTPVPAGRRIARLAGLWLAAFVLLLVAATNANFTPDEFIFVNDAKRFAAGELPTRDFFQFVMPGWLVLTGLLFKLTGPSLLAARALQAALGAATAIAYGHLARALGASRAVAALVALVPICVFWLPRFTYNHRWFAQAGVALTLALAWRALGRADARAWGLVGLGCGLTYATHQQDGAVLVAGLGLGALWAAWYQRWNATAIAPRLLWGLGGLAAPLAALGLFFALHGALGEFLWSTHVWTLTHYRAPGNHNDVRFASDVGALLMPEPWISLPFFYAKIYSCLAQLALVALGPFVGLAWLLGVRRPAPGEAPDRRVAFLGTLVPVCLIGFVAALKARGDLSHVAAGVMPVVLLAGAAIAAWERLALPAAARGVRPLPALGLAAFVATGVVAFTELARRDPLNRPTLTSPDARIAGHPSMAKIQAYLKPGDTIFVSQNAAVFNFYLAPNPTRYGYWVPAVDGYNTPEQIAEIQADLARAKPRLLIMAARDQRRADKLVRALDAPYALREVVPHVMGGWRYQWNVYLYERAPLVRPSPAAPPPAGGPS